MARKTKFLLSDNLTAVFNTKGYNTANYFNTFGDTGKKETFENY